MWPQVLCVRLCVRLFLWLYTSPGMAASSEPPCECCIADLLLASSLCPDQEAGNAKVVHQQVRGHSACLSLALGAAAQLVTLDAAAACRCGSVLCAELLRLGVGLTHMCACWIYFCVRGRCLFCHSNRGVCFILETNSSWLVTFLNECRRRSRPRTGAAEPEAF